jgi:hypothetical protein
VAASHQTASAVCDDALPGDDDYPMQHLRNVILPGQYSSVMQFMPKPGACRGCGNSGVLQRPAT